MAEDTQRGVGEALRQAREDAGLEIADLARTTRIGARYIAALEAEEWEAVPGAVIGRGFLRVLARELRLDPAPLLEAYRAARGESDETPDHSLPEADWKVDLRSERRRRPLLVGGGALVVLVAALWYWSPRPGMESPPPAPMPEVAAEPAAAPATPPPQPAPPPAEAAPPAAASPVAASAPHRLVIQAVEKVWVRVQADGGEPRDRMLQPGQRVEYEVVDGAHVKLGNAGSVRLSWDGASLLVPGKRGEVKTLEFPAALARLRP